MSKIDNGGPAFPQADPITNELHALYGTDRGMTLRQYAAIKLRVPDSGLDWLDRMIRESQRDGFAEKAMQGFAADPEMDEWRTYGIALLAYRWADAMLAARKEGAA